MWRRKKKESQPTQQPNEQVVPSQPYQYDGLQQEKSVSASYPEHTIIIPGWFVTITQKFVSLIVSQTKYRDQEFKVTEFDIILIASLISSLHFAYTHRKESQKYKRILDKTMEDLHSLNLKFVAIHDSRTRRRGQTLYYKSQATYYDIETEVRGEIRAYIEQINGLIEILSMLCMRSLREVSSLLKNYTLKQLERKKEEIHEERSRAEGTGFGNFRKFPNINGNNNNHEENRSQIEFQRQMNAIKIQENACEAEHARIDSKLEKFEEFFNMRQNREYLCKERETQKTIVSQEIAHVLGNTQTLDQVSNLQQQQQQQNQMSINNNNNSSELEDYKDEESVVVNMNGDGSGFGMQQQEPGLLLGGQPGCAVNGGAASTSTQGTTTTTQAKDDMLLEHDVLQSQYECTPFVKLDFETDVDKFNLLKLIERQAYEKEEMKQKIVQTEKWKKYKYASIASIVAASSVMFWFTFCYDGETDVLSTNVRKTKQKVNNARDSCNNLLARFGISLRV